MASLLSYALTSLSDVKESLGIASSNTAKDNLIIRKINQATLAIENYCGRRFKETTYTDEEYNATYIDELVLKQRPVTSTVTFSLSVRDTPLNENSWDVLDTEIYHVDNPSGVIYLLFNANGRWKSYRATYSAGYATIPEDLAEACASLAAYYVNESDSSSIGVSEKREGQRSLKYAQGGGGASGGFMDLCKRLGIDEIINSYANNPVMTDR